jgi:exodeoxyribonuclease V alpha subunit
LSTDVVEAVVRVHGGVKFYNGAAKSARAYVERDRSRADDYYLGEGSGVAERLIATPAGVAGAGSMDGDAYEQWVAGVDVDSGLKKGRVRKDANALRFVEVTVNGPKTWSLAAALHPEISAALDGAQDKAAAEIVGWIAQHATTRIGPRGRQVQVPVERIEAAVIRHHTSRAGDPHRHLHLQVNARVWAAGAWRGLHSVGVRDMIEAINGIGRAAVSTDPEFRAVLAARGFSLEPVTGEIEQLVPYVGAFSARTGQIHRNIDRYEAEWRREHPGEEPGPRLRETWNRRAWAEARPDKVVPSDGADLVARWNAELRALSYRDPGGPAVLDATRGLDRPGRGGGLGDLAARGEAVGMERRRHPREGRGPAGTDQPGRRPRRTDRARRGHHCPRRDTLRSATRLTRGPRARPIADLAAGDGGRGGPHRSPRPPCGAASQTDPAARARADSGRPHSSHSRRRPGR